VITAEEADDPSENALRLATMHRVKGLEFDHMLIPGLSAGVLPNRRVLNDCPDQISRDAFEQRERSLLHVAATRARKRVVITCSGEPSLSAAAMSLRTNGDQVVATSQLMRGLDCQLDRRGGGSHHCLLQMLEERGRGAVLVGVARVDAALERLLRERCCFLPGALPIRSSSPIALWDPSAQGSAWPIASG
jgi:hypothetical protein